MLVVDDQSAMHQHVRAMLWSHADAHGDGESQSLEDTGAFFADRGVEIDSARQGHEGVTRVREAVEAKRPYSLAIVDMTMPPGLDGIETVELMWEADPDLQVVLCARHFHQTWSEIARRLTRGDQFLLLTKPFEKLELVQAVHALTEKWWLKKKVDRANERRYRALYHGTPAMFFTLSADATVLSANRFAADALGFSVRELVGTPVAELHDDAHRDGYAEHLEDCLAARGEVRRWQGAKRRKVSSP